MLYALHTCHMISVAFQAKSEVTQLFEKETIMKINVRGLFYYKNSDPA